MNYSKIEIAHSCSCFESWWKSGHIYDLNETSLVICPFAFVANFYIHFIEPPSLNFYISTVVSRFMHSEKFSWGKLTSGIYVFIRAIKYTYVHCTHRLYTAKPQIGRCIFCIHFISWFCMWFGSNNCGVHWIMFYIYPFPYVFLHVNSVAMVKYMHVYMSEVVVHPIVYWECMAARHANYSI